MQRKESYFLKKGNYEQKNVFVLDLVILAVLTISKKEDFKNKVIQANWISLFQAQEMPKNKQRQKQIIIALVSHIGGIRKGTTFVLSNMFTSAD